jgi:uncharacterized protein (DUF427 family)
MSVSESPTQSPAFADAIRNPENPDHLMVIKPVGRRVRILTGDTLLADSNSAIRIMEIGRSVYDPVIYVPEADIQADLEPIDKSTHCPIKGDAGYRSFGGEEIAWTYETPLDMAADLAGHFAFWPSKVRVVEGE